MNLHYDHHCPISIPVARPAGLRLLAGMRNPGLFPAKTRIAPSSDGEPSAAEATHEELPPKEAARACLVAAEQLQKSGHVEQAISLYEKARRNDPGLKSVAHHLAVLYDAQGDSTRSLSEYNKAVESDPKNPGLLSDLGYYYYERGNLAEAEQSLHKALAIDPKHQKALSNLGLVLAGQGRFDESFAGLLQSGRSRRGPFQCRRAHGQARTLRPGPAGLPSRPSPWTPPCNNPRHSWPISTERTDVIANTISYYCGNRPVIVTVTVMRMMQVSSDQVVHVIAMRDGFMAATWTVDMSFVHVGRSYGSECRPAGFCLLSGMTCRCNLAALLLVAQFFPP